MKRWIAAAALVVLLGFAGLAVGATWAMTCIDGRTGFRITKYEYGCWEIAETDDVGTESPLITVEAQSALISYDGNTGAAGGSVTDGLKVYSCPACTKPTSNPEHVCFDLGGNQGLDHLSGLEGEPDTQNAHLRVGPGCYYFELGVDAPTNARVVVRGEGPAD